MQYSIADHHVDKSHPTTRYAIDVVEGRIVAGPTLRLACARHIDDLKKAPSRGFFFSEERASHAMDFFPEVLRLNGGQFEGNPFVLHDFQKFIVGSLFGWVDVNGFRRFTFAYIEVGKGNGKSPLVAGIGIYCLLADNEPRAEVYAAASKKDQAMILFRDAVAMVDMSPALSDRIKKSGRDDKVWNLYDPDTNSFFRPISSEDGQSGPRPHCGLIDELHEHKTPTVVNMLSAGKKSRQQPIIISITNSGTDKNTPCGEYHEKAKRVCAGSEMDDRFFGIICDLDNGEDPFKNKECWIKSNPLLGVTITERYLQDEINAATMPSKEASVRRLNFCQWTAAENPFINAAQWESSADEYGEEILKNKRNVIAGLDLSSVRDLTACVFAVKIGKKVAWYAMFWIPEDIVAEKVKEDKVPYDIWIRKGFLRTTPGNSISLRFIVGEIKDLVRRMNCTVTQWNYDRWRIDEFKTACKDNSFDIEPNMKEFGQGYQSMTPAIDAFERSLVNGEFIHPDNPVMNFCAANAVVRSDPAGGRKLDKGKNKSKRIDGIVAGVMAHLGASLQPDTDQGPRVRFL